MNGRKYGIMLMILAVIAAGMSGCGRKTSKDKSVQKVTGRYVESEVEFPEFEKEEKIMNLCADQEGNPILYTYIASPENHITVETYHLDQSGEFRKEEISWIKDLDLGEGMPGKMMQDEEGNLVFYCEKIENQMILGELYMKEEDKAKLVEIKDWKDGNKSGYIYNSDMVTLLKSNQTAWIGEKEIADFDLSSSKKTDRVDFTTGDRSRIFAGYGKVVVISGEYSETTGNDLKIDIFHEENLRESPSSAPMSVKGNQYSAGYVNAEGDIVIANGDGIHVLENGSTIWQTVVDGSLNQMYAEKSYCMDVTENQQKDYYILYKTGYGHTSNDPCNYQMMKYTMDSELAAVPEKTLSVYTLEKKQILQDAAILFQRKHPEVKVEITVGMSDEIAEQDGTGEMMEDCIQCFNTELLNHQGADVIVTDDLPVDSYIEKGALLDLTDVVQPMLKDDLLLMNIVESGKMQENYYTVPIAFNLPMVFCKADADKYADSLKGMADYAKMHENEPVLCQSSYQVLLKQFEPVYQSQFLLKDHVDKEKLIEFLEQVNILYQNSGSDSGEGSNYEPDIMQLPKESQMNVQETCGFDSMVFCLGVENTIQGKNQILNSSFYPQCQMSVNAYSEQTSLAKEYIQILLSQEIQSLDYGEGFPVNQKAMEAKQNVNGEEHEFYSYVELENGQSQLTLFQWPTREECQRIFDQCNSVQNAVSVNRDILSIVTEMSKNFFEGKETSTQAADAIENKINTYLSE